MFRSVQVFVSIFYGYRVLYAYLGGGIFLSISSYFFGYFGAFLAEGVCGVRQYVAYGLHGVGSSSCDLYFYGVQPALYVVSQHDLSNVAVFFLRVLCRVVVLTVRYYSSVRFFRLLGGFWGAVVVGLVTVDRVGLYTLSSIVRRYLGFVWGELICVLGCSVRSVVSGDFVVYRSVVCVRLVV